MQMQIYYYMFDLFPRKTDLRVILVTFVYCSTRCGISTQRLDGNAPD